MKLFSKYLGSIGLGAAFLASACLWSHAALAEVPAGGDPNPTVETEAPDTPDASVTPRGWLKQKKHADVSTAKDESDGTSWPVAALVLLSALGGAALFMKFKKGAPSFLGIPSDVRVVSTTRLSTKANLIVAEVHGRALLLGVTEHTVSELGWLDAVNLDAAEAPEATYGRADTAPVRSAGRFGDSLAASLGRSESGRAEEREQPFRGNPNVAALIAANAPPDQVYTRKSSGRPAVRAVKSEPAPARIEDQVAGLARRRR